MRIKQRLGIDLTEKNVGRKRLEKNTLKIRIKSLPLTPLTELKILTRNELERESTGLRIEINVLPIIENGVKKTQKELKKTQERTMRGTRKDLGARLESTHERSVERTLNLLCILLVTGSSLKLATLGWILQLRLVLIKHLMQEYFFYLGQYQEENCLKRICIKDFNTSRLEESGLMIMGRSKSL